ncbi:MAG TPA: peptide-N-glycosidase F-related protein [Polyangiaceae bacterium]|jgi:hypothetical protein|nr:peptide-N-glycosidase F-related protein [Polyangiaceae bacterium]
MRTHSILAVFAFGLVACGDTGTSSGGGGGGGGAPAAPYSITAFDAARITSDGSQPNFQKITADIDLKDGPFADVRIAVDLESTCYPFDKWQDNPPPEGQNWPADCDAFDRNFEISLFDPAAPEGAPGIELIHAITPFGGPLHLEADITDIVNAHGGAQRLQVVIPTYSDGAGQVSGSNGGWNVTAKIDATPGTPPRKVLAVQSIFYGTTTDPMGPGDLAFEVPEGTKSGRIEYRTTGHGGPNTGPGCNGPAEEFCKHTHSVLLDGAEILSIDPYRTDCADLCTITHYGDPAPSGFDYCLENPCGAISSVKASRANWCPGSETPPIVLDLQLGAGTHQFSWAIPELVDGGQWSVSATYFAYGQ